MAFWMGEVFPWDMEDRRRWAAAVGEEEGGSSSACRNLRLRDRINESETSLTRVLRFSGEEVTMISSSSLSSIRSVSGLDS